MTQNRPMDNGNWFRNRKKQFAQFLNWKSALLAKNIQLVYANTGFFSFYLIQIWNNYLKFVKFKLSKKKIRLSSWKIKQNKINYYQMQHLNFTTTEKINESRR